MGVDGEMGTVFGNILKMEIWGFNIQPDFQRKIDQKTVTKLLKLFTLTKKVQKCFKTQFSRLIDFARTKVQLSNLQKSRIYFFCNLQTKITQYLIKLM